MEATSSSMGSSSVVVVIGPVSDWLRASDSNCSDSRITRRIPARSSDSRAARSSGLLPPSRISACNCSASVGCAGHAPHPLRNAAPAPRPCPIDAATGDLIDQAAALPPETLQSGNRSSEQWRPARNRIRRAIQRFELPADGKSDDHRENRQQQCDGNQRGKCDAALGIADDVHRLCHFDVQVARTAPANTRYSSLPIFNV